MFTYFGALMTNGSKKVLESVQLIASVGQKLVVAYFLYWMNGFGQSFAAFLCHSLGFGQKKQQN